MSERPTSEPRIWPPYVPDPSSNEEFRGKLLAWFDAEKRSLPWRANRDPYRVWVSEIMLQQTRVAVVVGYYERFIERFPDVHKLARAREATVLAAWSGLGYYRRARALHTTAKVVVKQMGGEFPRSVKELQKLPGIGRYTAAAIASIAFGQRAAVVDGNVERVLGRLVGAEPEAVLPTWEIAQELLSPERPGDFNQAMMELGATVCTPMEPECRRCPVWTNCRTRGAEQPREREARNKQEIAVALAITSGQVYLVRRAADSTVMPDMWELPRLDSTLEHETLFVVRHSIMNTDYRVTVGRQVISKGGGEWVPYGRAARLPLTGVTRKILAKAGIIE